LEKQISNIKSQENSHWSFKDKDRSSSEKANCSDDEVLLDDIDEIDEYKDYDSVQVDAALFSWTSEDRSTTRW
jgi:hypothetical protein